MYLCRIKRLGGMASRRVQGSSGPKPVIGAPKFWLPWYIYIYTVNCFWNPSDFYVGAPGSFLYVSYLIFFAHMTHCSLYMLQFAIMFQDSSAKSVNQGGKVPV